MITGSQIEKIPLITPVKISLELSAQNRRPVMSVSDLYVIRQTILFIKRYVLRPNERSPDLIREALRFKITISVVDSVP